jgi:microcystin-dependent protein
VSSLDAQLNASSNAQASDSRPLSAQEFQLLQRLLSDPFSLPIQFKTWLISYLESSDLNLPISAIQGLSAALGVSSIGSGGTLGTLPAGLILPYGGPTAPQGSKMCDGASYSRATESRLFAAIGTGFGSLDPDTFLVPDLQERIPVGKGTMLAHNALNKNEGQPLGQRGTAHKTSIVLAPNPHAHTLTAHTGFSTVAGSGSAGPGSGDKALLTINTTDPTSLTATGGPGTGPTDTPAFLTVNFIIIA